MKLYVHYLVWLSFQNPNISQISCLIETVSSLGGPGFVFIASIEVSTG
jgi:hypothetical protein